ncbi:MAG: FIST N-terminal domain-containing protein [Polyangiaceae bacterium]
MRWATAISERDDTDRALEEVLTILSRRLEGPAQLALLFATPDHQDAFDELGARVLAGTRASRLLGCSGSGVLAGGREVEQRPALAVMAGVLPETRIESLHVEASQLPESPHDWHRRLRMTPEDQPQLLLLGDPFAFDPEAAIASLEAAYPGAPIVGGMASGGLLPRTNALFVDATTHRSGGAVLALSGNVRIDPVIAQGCRPVGDTMLVTSCDGHVIHALDSAPPGEVLQRLAESLAPEDLELLRDSLFLGVEMKNQREYAAGDFLIRNILGLQADGHALAVATLVERWQAVQFHLRDDVASRQDLEAQLERFREQAPTPPRAALLFSCVGRGAQLYGEPHHDSRRFQEIVGEMPLAGFFCNGEIGPVGGRTYLHGYTSAFAMIGPRSTIRS